MTRSLVILAALCLSLQIVYGDTNYRLNTSIVPTSYAIHIVPYFETGDEHEFTFDGEVTIDLFTETPTNQIKLHSEDLNFTASNITVKSGSLIVNLDATSPLEFDKKYSFAYINLASGLLAGAQYTVNIVYRGPMRKDLSGFYRNYYMEKGVKKWLGATQLEPTNARKVFPCFDEPGLKATFTLTIDRPEHYQPSLANTKLQTSVPLRTNSSTSGYPTGAPYAAEIKTKLEWFWGNLMRCCLYIVKSVPKVRNNFGWKGERKPKGSKTSYYPYYCKSFWKERRYFEKKSNGLVRETFYTSPKMPTYLVAFLISEFPAANYMTNGTREFGVFTRPEAANQSSYAFDFGGRVVNALSDYFGIDYYSTDSNLKLDHVALPDFRAGAMENWGLVKYRESLLLYVPEESTPYYKYRVAQIVAHETTHMWFGNLVTCHWWSDTWLNEGFANYFQDYITSLIEPDVGSSDMLVTGSVYAAYDADDSLDAHPISNNDVNSPAEISGHFGTITYQKAGSVIRMMHHLLGDNAFILGLHLYLNENKFNSGYPEKMYSALEQGVASVNALAAYPATNITHVMSSWISQAGHPVLHVDIDYENETVVLTQKRFYIHAGNESNELYKIPITYTTGVNPDFNNTKPEFVMEGKEHSFKLEGIGGQNHNWVLFNVQETGLYRVNYDDHSWKMIAETLKSDHREKIHHLNRAKIVNDLFAFVYADEVTFDRLYSVLEFLTEETDYSVWYAAIRGFNKLRKSYLGTEALSSIEAFESMVLDKAIAKLGYVPKSTEGTVALRNRMQVLEYACKIGHQGCIDNAVKIFQDFKENGSEISPSLRPVAYWSGLRNGNGDDYDFLWRRMATTNVANEASTIADALACTKDEEKLKKFLVSMQEENSPIRFQDLTVPLTGVLSQYGNSHLVMEELQNNYDLWAEIYPSMDTVLTAIASSLHTEAEFDEFETFLSSCTKCPASAVEAARKSLTSAKAAAAWAKDHQAAILETLKSSAFAQLPSCAMLILGLAVLFLKF